MSSDDRNPVPKLFISYSWTSPDHEAWVLQLATDLRESGIDVILDKWDLKEGHDAHAFMEQMVTDPSINKVLLICDKGYVEKANRRSGGAGTEAQIISAEIYAKRAQDKFVAVLTERDESGHPFLPAYYSSRIYIDLSDPSKYSDNFDRLLRWAHDRPLYQRPEIGKRPEFLSDEAIALATSSRFRRAIDAVANHREYSLDAVAEYLICLTDELEKFRLRNITTEIDEAVVQSIEAFLPYRNQAIQVFLALAINSDTQEMRTSLHRFFERLIPYLDRPPQLTRYHEWDFDNFRFIVHELFLYAVASLMKHERFEWAADLMTNDYYAPGNSYGEMLAFPTFSREISSLDHRNNRLQLRHLSLHGQLLKERCKEVGIQFRELAQADLILFLRSCMLASDFYLWWPNTLVFTALQSGPFEIFARSRSTRYFNRIKPLIDAKDIDELRSFIEDIQRRRLIPRWQYHTFSPAHLLGLNEIATKP